MNSNVHRSIVYKSQDMEAIKMLSTDEQIKKMCCIYTMEYYHSGIKNETMSFAATWMATEIIILSEVSQMKTYHMVPLISGL